MLVYGLHQGEPAKLLADFAEQTGITFPLVYSQGTLQRFAFPPGVGYPFPRDVIVGPDLRIVSVKTSFSIEEVEADILSALGKPTQ